jgi:hypothetical protein
MTVATAGPWSIRMGCLPGGTGFVNVQGPGSFYDTTASRPVGGVATVRVNNAMLGASGVTVDTAAAGEQVSVDVHLVSVTTMYELHLQLTSVSIAPNMPSCTMVGSILPVT